MTQARANVTKSPAAPSVRGFLNLAAALPDFGAVPISERTALGVGNSKGVAYGDGNTVPVVALAAAMASGTAYRCLERRAQFLEGTGYGPTGDTTLFPGHATKTVNDAWAEFCSYGAWFNGVAVLVRYKGEEGGYAIGEEHILPFGAVRKTASGTFFFNHKFGRKGFRSSDTTEHRPFNPDPEVVKAEMEADMAAAAKASKPYVQAGQIYYVYRPKAGEEDYPLPPHWAGLDAVLTDAAYSNFDLSEVRRGFMAKGILVMLGELDDSIKDEHGMTELDRQNELLRRYTVQGALEQGEERESIMVMGAKTKEEAPIWLNLATTTDLKWLSEKKISVGEEVCRHIGIPPILAGFATAGKLGSSEELLNANQLTQDTLEPLRKLLIRAFWALVPAVKNIVPGIRETFATTATTPATTPA